MPAAIPTAAGSMLSSTTPIAPSPTMMKRSGSIRHFALAYSNRGNGPLRQGRCRRRHADFDAAIKFDPKLAIAYGNRGYLYYRKRDMAHAIEDYSTQIQLSPDIIAYLKPRQRLPLFRPTRPSHRRLCRSDQTGAGDARGWRNRGMMRLYKGDNQGGLEDYDMALQYDPADVCPGTIAPRPRCGSATNPARSRISGRRWSFAPIWAPRAPACSDSASRRSGGRSLRSRLSTGRHSQGVSR